MPASTVIKIIGKKIKAIRGMSADTIFSVANWTLLAALVLGVMATYAIVVSGNIKEDKLKRDLADAAKAAAEANNRAEILKAHNLSLESTLMPRHVKFDPSFNTQEGAFFLSELKKYRGTNAVIQAIPDFEARTLGREIDLVLRRAGWHVQLVAEKETHFSPDSILIGVGVHTPALSNESLAKPLLLSDKAWFAGETLINLLRQSYGSPDDEFSNVHWEYGKNGCGAYDIAKMGFHMPKENMVVILVGSKATSWQLQYENEKRLRELEEDGAKLANP